MHGGYKDLAIKLSANTNTSTIKTQLCKSQSCPVNTTKDLQSTNPIEVSFTPDVLLAGTKDIDASISVKVNGSLVAGTYPLTLYASYIPQGSVSPISQQIGSLNLKLDADVNPDPSPQPDPKPPIVVPGSLNITPSPTIEQIGLGYKRYITVSLNNSQNVSNFNVTLASSNPAVATVTAVEPEVCTLSTKSNVCTIAVNGVSLGGANITASATGYTSVKSSVSVVQYAYIIGQNTDDNLSKCIVTESTILPNSCVNIKPDADITTANAISFNKDYAFITNNNGTYTTCHLGVNGLESETCKNTQPTVSLSQPFGIVFSSNYAYITNTILDGYLTQCNLESSGTINNDTCINLNKTLSYASDGLIAQNYVYLTQQYPGFNISYLKCNISESGLLELDSCSAAPSKDTGFRSSVFVNSYGDFIYFTQDKTYSQCPINSEGIIDNTSCTNTDLPLISMQEFSFAGTNAYFGSYSGNTLQCAVNQQTGVEPSTCKPLVLENINLTSTRGISIH